MDGPRGRAEAPGARCPGQARKRTADEGEGKSEGEGEGKSEGEGEGERALEALSFGERL